MQPDENLDQQKRNKPPIKHGGKGKGKRGNGKQQRGSVYKSERNDFSWYNAYPQYTEYAGTMPFGKPLGLTFNMYSLPEENYKNADFVIPGLMTIGFSPVPGFSVNKGSAMNRAAMRIYAYLRQAQKAGANYDSQDMMMSFLALDSLYMYHAWLKRVLGLSNLANPLNRYAPDGLITANWVDPDNLRKNSDKLWGYINKLAIDMQSFAMPKNIDFRIRHEWMCSGIYADAKSVRAQLYMFVPDGFWKYNNTAEAGSELIFIKLADSNYLNDLYTVDALIDLGNMLYNAISGDEDLGDISGDMANALGENGVVRLTETDRWYKVEPTYSEVVLQQIENSIAMGGVSAGSTINQIPQVNEGAIVSTPTLQYMGMKASVFKNHKVFLNFHVDKPSVENVIEATRLTGIYNGRYKGNNEYVPQSYGTEVVSSYRIWRLVPGDAHKIQVFAQFYSEVVMGVTLTGAFENPYGVVSAISAFDWHPSIYVFSAEGTASVPEDQTVRFHGVLCDFETTAVLDYDKLSDMHEAALTSEFDLKDIKK